MGKFVSNQRKMWAKWRNSQNYLYGRTNNERSKIGTVDRLREVRQMKHKLLLAALIPIFAVSPGTCFASEDGIIRPAAVYAVKFLFNKLVVDECWDAATGKPDLKKVERRLRELEETAALRGELQDEIRKLRQQMNERVTRDEFKRMVERTASEIRTIQQRLDEHDEEIEKLKVLQEDLKNSTNNSSSAAYYLRRGVAYEGDGKSYKAVACYNIAIQLMPTDVSTYLHRSQFFIKTGAAAVGIADATEAIRLDSKSASAYHYRALGYLAEKNYDGAVEDLSKALSLNTYNTAPLYAALGAARFYRGEYELAISNCDVSLRNDPNPLAYRARAMAYSARKEFDKAIADANEAIRWEPKNAENLFVRLEANLARKEKELPLWRSTPKGEAPGTFNGQNFADMLGSSTVDPLLADAEEGIRLAPKSAKGYYLRGLWHARERYYNAAVKDYSEAIKLDPTLAIAYNGRAMAYTHSNRARGEAERTFADLTNAIEDATEAIRLDPKFVDAYCNRGSAFLSRGHHTLGPFDPNPNKEAFAKERQIDRKRAVIDLTRAITLDPKCAKAYNDRCTAYVVRDEPGDSARADADFKELRRLLETP